MNFDEYSTFDAADLAAAIRARQVSSEEVLACAIQRADDVNPHLNAIIHRQYDWARATIRHGLPDGPFTGVPILLKDLSSHVIGWPMTFGGSSLFRDYVCTHTSELVRRYQAAGLVPFARTTSPEFGLTTTSASRMFGRTHNPWNSQLSPGGSSGGAAAAVAAGIVPVAHGGDGGGSLRIPAAFCGLVGLKPTRGRMPAGPAVGEAVAGLATSHVLSRSVRDTAAFLDVGSGPDVGAPNVALTPERKFVDEIGAEVGRLRIGLQLETFNGVAVDSRAVDTAYDAARLCEELGHHVEPVNFTADAEQLTRVLDVLFGVSTLSAIQARASGLGRNWNEDDVEPITAARLASSMNLSAVDYFEAVASMHALGRRIAGFFDRFDVIMSPTTATVAEDVDVLALDNPDEEAYFDHWGRTIAFTYVFNVAGAPAVSLPLGWPGDGIPIGVQFAAPHSHEAVLLRLAAQLEAARPWAHRHPANVTGADSVTSPATS